MQNILLLQHNINLLPKKFHISTSQMIKNLLSQSPHLQSITSSPIFTSLPIPQPSSSSSSLSSSLYSTPSLSSLFQSSKQCTQIKYIDCRNWLQFVEQLIILLLSIALLLHIVKHYRNLKKQKQEDSTSEYQRSIRRKIRVNLIQILYLFTLISNTIYDIILYFWYRKERPTIHQYNLDNWYKITQFLYVNLLNTLNLTVGFLYWKATRAYYVLSELEQPWLYRRWAKGVFFVLFGVNGVAVGSVVVLEIVGIRGDDVGLSLSLFTLISTTTSIVCCIGCRLLYSKHILTKIDLPSRAATKQQLISFLLLFSSILRITLYIIDVTIPNWTSKLRNQILDEQQICMDVQIYYSFILLGINLFINLLPAVIYGHLFVSEVKLGVVRDQREERKGRRKGSKDGSGHGSRGGSKDWGKDGEEGVGIRRRLFSD